MNLIINIVSAAVFLFLGALVLFKNSKSITNIVFFITCWFMAQVMAGMFLLYSGIAVNVLHISRLNVVSGILVVSSILSFSTVFPKPFKVKSKLLVINTFSVILAVFVILTPWAYKEAALVDGRIVSKKGILYLVYAAWIAVMLVIIVVNFLKKYRFTKSPLIKKQLHFVFFGLVLGALIGTTSSVFLPVMEIYNLHHVGLSLAGLLVISSMCYVLLKTRLIDIRMLIQKTAVWVFISSLIFVFVFLAVHYSIGIWDGFNKIQKTMYVIVVCLFIFLYLKYIQPKIDTFFMRRKRNIDFFFSEFVDELSTLKSLWSLQRRIQHTLHEALYVKKVSMYVKDTGYLYNIRNKNEKLLIEGKFLKHLLDEDDILEAESVYYDSLPGQIAERVRRYCSRYECSLILPLIFEGDMIGIINVGRKENLKRFYDNEIDFLRKLKGQIEIALNNSLLITQLEDKVLERTIELHKNAEFLRKKNLALEFALSTIDRDVGYFRNTARLSEALISEEYFTFEDLFKNIISIFPKVINMKNMSIYVYNEDKNNFRLFSFFTRNKRVKRSSLIIPGDGKEPLAWMLTMEDPAVIFNIEDKTFSAKTFAKYRMKKSMVCIGIRNKGKLLAVINLIDKMNDEGYDKYDLLLFSTIQNLLSISAEKIKILEAKIKEERFVSLGHVATTVIHDIKGPLSGIKGFVEFIGSPEFTKDEKAGYIQTLNNEIDSIIATTAEILEFARGEIHLKKQQVNVQLFFEEICLTLKPDFESRHINIQFDNQFPGNALFDSARMRRVIFNIAWNAADALTKGGIFTISVSRKKTLLVIELADDGPGIAEKIKATLFDPFCTYGKQTGTGLGMAIAKKIVDEHSGTISFISKRGKGTVFTIEIPMTDYWPL